MKIKLLVCFCLLLLVFSSAKEKQAITPVFFKMPNGWPAPAYNFTNNPLTEEGILLGQTLFYDPILSRDSTISCASCHLQATGFAHVDHDLSHGIDNRIGTRNAASIMNLAWSKTFFWDGSINHLDVLPLAPIEHKDEMDLRFAEAVKKIKRDGKYRPLYANAFGTIGISGERTLKALSQYMLTLVSANAKYDAVMAKKDSFTIVEQKGYLLFKQHCSSCHTEPLFTNGNFENNGLPIDTTLNDMGRMRVSTLETDRLKFKVPTLRNIQFTYPYMHDGRFATLTEVLKHYNTGIYQSATLSDKLKTPMQLSDNQRVEIVAFLKTLTDTEFLLNKKYGFIGK